jgi:hypothetical protein
MPLPPTSARLGPSLGSFVVDRGLSIWSVEWRRTVLHFSIQRARRSPYPAGAPAPRARSRPQLLRRPSRARRSRPTQLPRVPSLTPSSRAQTCAIGLPVSDDPHRAPLPETPDQTFRRALHAPFLQRRCLPHGTRGNPPLDDPPGTSTNLETPLTIHRSIKSHLRRGAAPRCYRPPTPGFGTTGRPFARRPSLSELA